MKKPCEKDSRPRAVPGRALDFGDLTSAPSLLPSPEAISLMRSRMRLACAGLAVVLGFGPAPGVTRWDVLQAQEPAGGTPAVFRNFGERVVKIEISETGSAAKASLGSGFYVSAEGDVITNYHVVSQMVMTPGRYGARIISSAGDTLGVQLLAIDVVHDLALVRSSAPPRAWFTLHPVAMEQGDRLFSLGHPRDLGLSIVEGTYNGLLRHTLYPKIHFTGSLNPGMSGGPTLSASGDVVGVNVSTEGNQVSFLVPADQALALLERSRRPGFQPADSFLVEAGRQILAYQATYLDRVFRAPVPTVTIGRFTLPTEPAPFFKCWADADRSPEQPYETVSHQCSTDDYVYLSEDQASGMVELTHRVLSSSRLNRFRFFALYNDQFSGSDSPLWGDEDDVTSYKCVTRNVRRGGARILRTAFCARRYRRMTGLYDVVVRAAALAGRNQGLVTTLTLAGVSYENAERVARRFLESISWSE